MKEPKGSTDKPSIESLLADLLSLFSVAGWTDHDLLDAISELSALRAENERLRLIETGAKDSEALVAHLRAENEALKTEVSRLKECLAAEESQGDMLTKSLTAERARADEAEKKAETHAGIWRAQEAMIQAALEPLGVQGPPWDNHAVEDAADMIRAERARADALAARVEALNEIIRDVSDREGLTDQEYRDWRKLPPIETSLSAHDARRAHELASQRSQK